MRQYSHTWSALVPPPHPTQTKQNSPATTMNSVGFLQIAAPITNRLESFDSHASRIEFKRMFGACPEACEWIWSYNDVNTIFPLTSRPIHLLWAMYFLQHYHTVETIIAHVGTTKKTYLKHMWPIVEGLERVVKHLVSKERRDDDIVRLFPFVLTNLLAYYRLK